MTNTHRCSNLFKVVFEEKKIPLEQPLAYQSISMDEIRAKGFSESQMIEFLDLPEFRGLSIKSEKLEKYVSQLKELEGSKIVLNKFQKEEQFADCFREAAKEILDRDAKEIIRRKLEEISYVLCKFGKEEESKLSLSAAIYIKEDSQPLEKNQFLFELIRRSILRLKEIKEVKEKDEPSFIYKP